MDDVNLFWHRHFVSDLARLVKPRCYVEVGLAECETFNRVLPYAEAAYGVDVWPGAQGFMKGGEFHCGTSTTFAESHPLLEIDMAFIDADHMRVEVLRDFDNLWPLMAKGGLVLLHDTHPLPEGRAPSMSGTAYQAGQELVRRYGGVAVLKPPGLTIIQR